MSHAVDTCGPIWFGKNPCRMELLCSFPKHPRMAYFIVFFWFFRKFLDFPCRWYACLLLAQHEFEMKPWCVSLKIFASSGYHIKKMNKIKTRLFRMRGGSRRCFGRKRFAVIGINSCEIRVQQHKRAMIGMTRPLRIGGRGNTGP